MPDALNPTVQIRSAQLTDFDRIRELNRQHFVFERQFTSTFNIDWPDTNQAREYFAKRLVNANSHVTVAVDGDKIVGYLVGHIDNYPVRAKNPVAEIEVLFIEESYRSQGVGRLLMREFDEFANIKGAKIVKVMCLIDNKQALDFYRKHGMKDLAVILEREL